MSPAGDAAIELVTASANPDKVAEIQEILADVGVRLMARPASAPEIEETEDTLLGNAILKARAVAEHAGLPAVADDTGLEVDALGGDPGVRAARYAGEHAAYADNVEKLLSELSKAPDRGGARRARFRTVAVVWFPEARPGSGGERGGRALWREGTVEGAIAPAPRGDGGFGYDPVFVPDEGGGRTFAEMSGVAKHAISHRGRAFRSLARALRECTGDAARSPR